MSILIVFALGLFFVFFFFQAEDGIRDVAVTGVQTCALPISWTLPFNGRTGCRPTAALRSVSCWSSDLRGPGQGHSLPLPRSEERRVGKECRSRWSPYH